MALKRFRTRCHAGWVQPMSSDIRQPLTTVGETTGSFPGRASRPARQFKTKAELVMKLERTAPKELFQPCAKQDKIDEHTR